jgi:hypothetical protein
MRHQRLVGVLSVLSAVVACLAGVPVALPAAAGLTSSVMSQLTWPADLVAGQLASTVVAVSPHGNRRVLLQVRTGGAAWRTTLSTTTNSSWLVPFDLTVRRTTEGSAWRWRVRSGGEWTTAARTRDARVRWRVVAPATSSAGPASSRAVAVTAAARPATPPFPLGRLQPTQVAVRDVAPGLRLASYRHGSATQDLTVTALVAGQLSGPVSTAQALAARIRDAGLPAGVELMVAPAGADYGTQVHAFVRSGRWPLDEPDRAQARVRALEQRGIPAVVSPVAQDGLRTTGPWRVTVLDVDPERLAGTCRTSLGRTTAGRETVSSMGSDLGAIAGVNGGFFSIDGPAGFEGDPTGVSVVAGGLRSEATPGRTALVLDGCDARVTRVTTTMGVTAADGASRTISAVNRPAPAGSLVLMTDDLGRPTPSNDGVDVVVDGTSTVLLVRAAGRLVPAGTRVLHATGPSESWLRTHALPGTRLRVSVQVQDQTTGRAIPDHSDIHVVGGSVGLLRAGAPHITAGLDGHASIGMTLRRQPRTLAGVTDDGRLLLVAVDGRDPQRSVGVSFPEAAALLRWLGATEGLSMDGGGSTTMLVQGEVVNRPSDGVERPVGDAVFVVP